MSTYHWTALVTLLALLFYGLTGVNVARARKTFGVRAPATTGQADFERAFRVQMNTLEWLPIFLPSLWLFAVYLNDAVAAGLGLAWIVGRVIYFVGYVAAAEKRRIGFTIQMLATGVLFLGAVAAVVRRLLA